MELEEVKRLSLKPEEVLVLRYSKELDNPALEAIGRQLRLLLPGIKILIISGAEEIAVLTQEKAEVVKHRGRKSSGG